MSPAEFDAILDARVAKMRSVLAMKAGEYASILDRLHNFKRAAGITGESRWQVCIGFFVKHLTSILDLVDKRTKGNFVSPEVIDEKVGDAINYLVLLEALFLEKAD